MFHVKHCVVAFATVVDNSVEKWETFYKIIFKKLPNNFKKPLDNYPPI